MSEVEFFIVGLFGGACLVGLFNAQREIRKCDKRLDLWTTLEKRFDSCECSVCNEQVDPCTCAEVVRVSNKPYLKVICARCGKNHQFFPIVPDGLESEAAAKYIDYKVVEK